MVAQTIAFCRLRWQVHFIATSRYQALPLTDQRSKASGVIAGRRYFATPGTARQ